MTATTTHYRPDARCARAFLNQHELPPFQELLRDTAAWLEPAVGQRWLDVGCGAGQLSRILWEKSQGKVETIVGVDSAVANAQAFANLRASLKPSPTPACLRFVPRDLSLGFNDWPSEQFDGVASGLALQYAESHSEDGWTELAYDGVLCEVHRLLKLGAPFVFSVNIPNPAWSKVALSSIGGALQRKQPLRYLKNAWRLWSYGNWLNRESKRGRFHYLPVDTIVQKLETIGFTGIEHRLSYAGQAYLFRCKK